ncbi:glycosyltransferase [Marinitoga piezophila KA3]|uniref:Glycosyltransferase n=1 Tax=Marinitoga piezophila (strain DSM 14283 / JCM 11233 / KA3) TaxID=443254 RepID=H2J2V7_MARPK|nr:MULTISPECIES: glycosyltransferase [Marinitoga]AEX85648.1 glycosyltransferase [Marinitoga piezophila KA3]APT76101.1 hypothetical protein LN42_06690 [Marinitoga sp. 1137]
MKKILILDHAYWYGGAEKVLVEFLKGYNRNKYDITVGVTCESEFTEKLNETNVKYEVFPLSRDVLEMSRSKLSAKLLPKYIEYKKMIKSIEKFIKKEKIDLIFTNSMKAHIYGGQLSRKLGIKAVARVHDHINDEFIKPLKLLLKNTFNNDFYHISCVSNAVKNSLIEIGINKNKLSVLYNGITLNPSLKSMDFYKNLYKISEDDFIIGTVGWIHPNKNQLLILQGLHEILKDNIKLMIVGGYTPPNKNYYMSIKNYINSNNLENNVILTGHTKDISGHYSIMDTLIHFPETDSLPTVLIEGIISGKTVVARNISGIPEILNNKNGYLVDSIEEAKDIIFNIYKYPEKYKLNVDMEDFEKKFSYDNYIKGIEELLEK